MFEICDLSKAYGDQRIKAVRQVSLRVEAGKTVGILGGSGSGKSTLLRLAMGFENPDEGQVRWEGKKVDFSDRASRMQFYRKAQMIFQDPHSSLNPRMRVREILSEPLTLLSRQTKVEVPSAIEKLIGLAGLNSSILERYPRQISGGEGQRVAILRALAAEPKLLLCDEVISSLDVLTKIQIVNLLLKLQRERGLSLVFVSHDERVLRHLSDTIFFMKEGRLSRI